MIMTDVIVPMDEQGLMAAADKVQKFVLEVTQNPGDGLGIAAMLMTNFLASGIACGICGEEVVDMVLDSICRIRSRVTPNFSPIWSKVIWTPSPRPNRERITPASRGCSESRIRSSSRCNIVKPTASAGTTASVSSMRSPNSLSPSSPSGVESEIGSRPYF